MQFFRRLIGPCGLGSHSGHRGVEMHPEIAEYFRELAVDFCVRFPEEATKQRESKEWEKIESQFSPKKMAALSNEYNESHSTQPESLH